MRTEPALTEGEMYSPSTSRCAGRLCFVSLPTLALALRGVRRSKGRRGQADHVCFEKKGGNGRIIFLARLRPEGVSSQGSLSTRTRNSAPGPHQLIESSSLLAKPLTRQAGTDGVLLPGLQCRRLWCCEMLLPKPANSNAV